MITLCVVLAIIILLLLLRFGVIAEYGESGARLAVKIGFFVLTLYPAREKKQSGAEQRAQKTRKEKKPRAKKPKETGESQKPGPIEIFEALLPKVTEVLSRIKRRLLVKHIKLYVCTAGEDPANAAINFGRISAVMPAVHALLDNNFRVKDCDFRANTDFSAEKMTIYAKLQLSLALWEIIYIAVAALGVIIALRKVTK